MKHVYDDPADLAKCLGGDAFHVIGIDGKDGVGKSTLATKLSASLNCPTIHLDDYLERDKGAYVEHIKYKEVGEALKCSSKVLIEGVCLLEVLERLRTSADYLIYVKYIRHGVWSDLDELVVDSTIEQHLEKLEEHMYNGMRLVAHMEQKPPPARDAVVLPNLAKEIVLYHAKYTPQNVANAEFHKTDS